jgi:hypothetical protein
MISVLNILFVDHSLMTEAEKLSTKHRFTYVSIPRIRNRLSWTFLSVVQVSFHSAWHVLPELHCSDYYYTVSKHPDYRTYGIGWFLSATRQVREFSYVDLKMQYF